MPLGAYDVDEVNAAVGAWALIEPIDFLNDSAGGCEGERARQQGSSPRTPNGSLQRPTGKKHDDDLWPLQSISKGVRDMMRPHTV